MLKKFIFLSFAVLLVSCSSVAFSGNHEVIHPTRGYSIGWKEPDKIPYWVDLGGLGMLSNVQARAILERMLKTWEDVESANVHFLFKGELPHDVTEENIAEYIAMTSCGKSDYPDIPSNVVPIIFDSNGKIIEYLTGVGSSAELGGLAALRCFEGSASNPVAIYQGMVVINGTFIDGKGEEFDSPEDLSLNVLAGVMLHEVGHLLGLDHSVVNDEFFNQISNEEVSAEYSKYLPVMLPTVLRKSVSSTTLHPDDISAISSLYPTDTFLSGVGEIEGEVLNAGMLDVRKANVIARRIDDPLCEAVSTLSGRRCTPLKDASGATNFNSFSCASSDLYGDYLIEGLLPGSYTIEIEELSEGWIRNGMYPSTYSEDLPGDAEFYNIEDASEEDPYLYTAVKVTADATLMDIDFVLSDRASYPDQLDRIPLDEFEEGPSSRCLPDPTNYSTVLEEPEDNLMSALNAATSDPGSNSSSFPGGGCQLIKSRRGASFSLALFTLYFFIIFRSRICSKNY